MKWVISLHQVAHSIGRLPSETQVGDETPGQNDGEPPVGDRHDGEKPPWSRNDGGPGAHIAPRAEEREPGGGEGRGHCRDREAGEGRQEHAQHDLRRRRQPAEIFCEPGEVGDDPPPRDDEVGGEQLKTSPRGYDSDHPRIHLLRHKQLFVGRSYGFESDAIDACLLDRVRADWKALRPLVTWLRATD